MRIFITIFLLCLLHAGYGQKLYVNSYGTKGNPAVLFLHGGPGYNSAGFEATTAQALADRGFFVITYDRRGEGRSKGLEADYTFEESFFDINQILKKHKLKDVTLLGHSFGGMVGTLFAEKNPEKVRSLILVGAPISLQESFKTILDSCKEIYTSKQDSINLNYIEVIEAMDSTTLEYSTFCFSHAMQNGFYSPKKRNPAATALVDAWNAHPELGKLRNQMSTLAPKGFWKNEHYTTKDLSPALSGLVASGKTVFGIYGKEDGLYSAQQIEALRIIIGKGNVEYLDDCSHNVYIDRQDDFLNLVGKWAR